MSLCKHVIDDGHKLHNPFVQVQILQSLEEIGVFTSVRTDHGDFLGFCLGGQDSHFQMK